MAQHETLGPGILSDLANRCRPRMELRQGVGGALREGEMHDEGIGAGRETGEPRIAPILITAKDNAARVPDGPATRSGCRRA